MIQHRRIRSSGQGVPLGLYRPGRSIATALGGGTLARNLAALQVGADLRYAAVGVNVLRDGHYIGTVRTTLLEPAAQNGIKQSCTMATTPWAGIAGSPVLTNAPTPQTAAGITLSQAEDDSAAGIEGVGQDNVAVTDGTNFLSLLLYPGTAASQAIRIVDVTAGPTRVRFQTNWSGGVLTVTNVTGTLISSTLQPDGAYRVILSGTGFVAANNNSLQLYPANTVAGDAALVGTCLAGGWQVEATAYATTPIITTTTALTRPADALAFTGLVTPAVATLYERYYDLATAAWADAVAAYTSGAAITPATGRAYTDIAVFPGTLTAAQARRLLGYSS